MVVNIDNLVPKFTDSDYDAFKDNNIEFKETDTYKILALKIRKILQSKSTEEASELDKRLFFNGGDTTRRILKLCYSLED